MIFFKAQMLALGHARIGKFDDVITLTKNILGLTLKFADDFIPQVIFFGSDFLLTNVSNAFQIALMLLKCFDFENCPYLLSCSIKTYDVIKDINHNAIF